MAERILIVDDEKSVRVTLREFLTDAGYEAEVAESLEQAWERLAAVHFDVVLTDIIMPRFTGVSLLKAIKETSLETKVILMTGEPTVETATDALRAGASDYLTKPFGKHTLLEAVSKALKVGAANGKPPRSA